MSNFVLCTVSAIVTGETVNEIYSRVKDVIRSHSGPVIWIPARHPLWVYLARLTLMNFSQIRLISASLQIYIADSVQLFCHHEMNWPPAVQRAELFRSHSYCVYVTLLFLFGKLFLTICWILWTSFTCIVCGCASLTFGWSSRHIALGAFMSFIHGYLRTYLFDECLSWNQD